MDLGPRSFEPQKRHRRKLWDIPEQYLCPIIGTCLHVDELRRLARKLKTSLGNQSSDFHVHVRFVSVAEEKCPTSVATQKLLDRKHAASIRRYAQVREGERIRELWQEDVASGKVPGALWALMTHPDADLDICAEAYRDVHMLSHQVGAGHVTDARLLSETRETLNRVRADARRDTERNRAAIAQRDKRITKLEERLAQMQRLETELDAARRTIENLESDRLLSDLKVRVRDLEVEIKNLSQSRDRESSQAILWRERCRAGDATLKRVTAELEDLRSANRVLEQLLGDDCDFDAGCDCCSSDPCEECPNLEGRRVLCVGGRSSLTCHYRSLVNRYNGEFIHHDGGMEHSRQRLDILLSAADVVVCPADCVSHDAYLKAKRYCKLTEKPCVLLKTSGVGSFARALQAVAG